MELHWNWGEVHQADRYLDDLEALRDANATSAQYVATYTYKNVLRFIMLARRAEYLLKQLRTLGLPTKIQTYNFSASTGVRTSPNYICLI